MRLGRRDITVAALTMAGTLAAVAAVDHAGKIGSSVYDWTAMKFQPTATGEVYQVLKGPTSTLNELEMHITKLNPGQRSHPPHKHPNEELIIIREGTVETLSNGQWKRVGPGSIILNGSNDVHDLRNVGSTPAVYHVVNWRTDKTPPGGTVVLDDGKP